ncbi:MAG: DUF3106 domain-containing protein [Sulfurimicrobium sp.]|nr:DUF3106 domain-containing protein [Sulfurimicrobium sp.]MDO9191071.1 DUF3106 domain-containing protein [Sulfurimicrobium sp.]MDP1704032.1 DUF3106 domain-containing protein [Sulfurimicrobium sp.]MDP2197422.1 DUF3106 domain-containing protein [Sulfurimicrobium sp.]MDP2961738.1 DUF3106 domain-containing protein [Sulfurimicrobium sp.]
MARPIVAALAVWLLLVSGASYAVDSAKPPQWSQLNPEQKQILSPVARNWDDMSARKRIKLLGVAKHYQKMTPLEQQRVQAQLKDWAELSPEERERARQRYQKFKQLPPEQRQELKQKWRQKAEQKPAAGLPPANPPVSANSAAALPPDVLPAAPAQ